MKKPRTPEELFNKIKSILEKRTCCRIFWTMGGGTLPAGAADGARCGSS